MFKSTAITTIAAVLAGQMAIAESTQYGDLPEVHAGPAHWEYPATGAAEDWADLSADYGLCGTGTEQSPIDLTAGIAADLPTVELGWSTDAELTVVNNGHTIQVNIANGGGVTVGDKVYDLLQFHFHTPSEHAVEGTRAPMEVHFVHKSADGALAVVGVLMNGGGTNALFNTVMTAVSVGNSDGFKLVGNYDLTDLMPEDRSVYRYQGSLTTPPCSETVLWTVLQNPVDVADDAISAYQAIFPMNARALQPANRRFILTN